MSRIGLIRQVCVERAGSGGLASDPEIMRLTWRPQSRMDTRVISSS